METYFEHISNELNKDKSVTYRYLSRTFSIHVDLAKEILFEFYTKEKQGNPTYLLSGILKDEYRQEYHDKHGGNYQDEMIKRNIMYDAELYAKDIPVAKPLENVPIHEFFLTDATHLEDYRKKLNLTGIHIHSISPHELKNYVELFNIAMQMKRELATFTDLNTLYEKAGIITNASSKKLSSKFAYYSTPSTIMSKSTDKSISPPMKKEVLKKHSIVEKEIKVENTENKPEKETASEKKEIENFDNSLEKSIKTPANKEINHFFSSKVQSNKKPTQKKEITKFKSIKQKLKEQSTVVGELEKNNESELNDEEDIKIKPRDREKIKQDNEKLKKLFDSDSDDETPTDAIKNKKNKLKDAQKNQKEVKIDEDLMELDEDIMNKKSQNSLSKSNDPLFIQDDPFMLENTKLAPSDKNNDTKNTLMDSLINEDKHESSEKVESDSQASESQTSTIKNDFDSQNIDSQNADSQNIDSQNVDSQNADSHDTIETQSQSKSDFKTTQDGEYLCTEFVKPKPQRAQSSRPKINSTKPSWSLNKEKTTGKGNENKKTKKASGQMSLSAFFAKPK